MNLQLKTTFDVIANSYYLRAVKLSSLQEVDISLRLELTGKKNKRSIPVMKKFED